MKAKKFKRQRKLRQTHSLQKLILILQKALSRLSGCLLPKRSAKKTSLMLLWCNVNVSTLNKYHEINARWMFRLISHECDSISERNRQFSRIFRRNFVWSTWINAISRQRLREGSFSHIKSQTHALPLKGWSADVPQRFQYTFQGFVNLIFEKHSKKWICVDKIPKAFPRAWESPKAFCCYENKPKIPRNHKIKKTNL